MSQIKFVDKDGTFKIENPENYSGLYFPMRFTEVRPTMQCSMVSRNCLPTSTTPTKAARPGSCTIEGKDSHKRLELRPFPKERFSENQNMKF